MTLRCDCPNDGDPVVFGPNHRCDEPEKTLPPLVPSWRFVVPESDPHDLEMRANPYDMDDAERGGY